MHYMNEKIAIQGIKGSFHHQVVLEYFSEVKEVEECLSFEEVVSSLITDVASQAVMALENSIAGSIIPNYALIDKHNSADCRRTLPRYSSKLNGTSRTNASKIFKRFIRIRWHYCNAWNF